MLEDACRRLDTHVVCGLLERDGDTIHNAAVLVGPDGLVGSYRKSHLPFLGVDRFVRAGRRAAGLRHADRPDRSRDLLRPALPGGDPIARARGRRDRLPADELAGGCGRQRELLAPARAYENRIYLLVANRVGKERTAEFCGRSQIVDPAGVRLAETDATSEALLVADIDLERAREKSIVPAPGEYEMHLFGHRRPDLYGALVEEIQNVTT